MTGNDVVDALLCTLVLAALVTFAILIRKAREDISISKSHFWILGISGTILCILAGFLWFVGSVILCIMNTPKWPFSNEGAPAWVDPVAYLSIPGGIFISTLLLVIFWRFLRRKSRPNHHPIERTPPPTVEP